MIFIALLSSCEKPQYTITGHWHEVLNGKVLHCYHLTDSTFAVDELTVGYKNPYEYINNRRALYSEANFEYSVDYQVLENRIIFNDSIEWFRVKNDLDEFIADLSIGLKVSIEPPELIDREFDFPYKIDNATYLYIGRLKNSLTATGEDFEIQMNDVISPINDVAVYVSCGHCNMNEKIAVLNADKDVPEPLIQSIVDEVLRGGILRHNIYTTAIDKNEMSMGLVQKFPKSSDQIKSQKDSGSRPLLSGEKFKAGRATSLFC
ncbi:MAG: hypothetical protein RIB63_11630 [Fulvivirga sp.]